MQLNQNQTRFSVHLSQESNKNCSVDRNPAHGGGSLAINAGSNFGIRIFFREPATRSCQGGSVPIPLKVPNVEFNFDVCIHHTHECFYVENLMSNKIG